MLGAIIVVFYEIRDQQLDNTMNAERWREGCSLFSLQHTSTRLCSLRFYMQGTFFT